jgi:hypothetical protein
LPAAFDRPREDFAEDFDADLLELLFDEDLPELFFGEVFDDFLPEDFFDDFFEFLRDEAAAFSTAVFAPDGPLVAESGRIMSAAAGLTAPTASAAVSRAALASPAACSPA